MVSLFQPPQTWITHKWMKLLPASFMLIQFLSPKDLHVSAATQTSPPPGGQLRVNWSAGSNVTSNGTSSWTLSSNQSSQTPSTSPNRLLSSAASSSQNATELKSNRSQTSSTFSTKSPDTPTPSGRSPKSSTQVNENTPGHSSPPSPSSTVPDSQSLGSTATTVPSPALIELDEPSHAQLPTESSKFNPPRSSSLPPNPLFTFTSITSLSQKNAKTTSPIAAETNGHTNMPVISRQPSVNAASAGRSPSSLTASSQSSAATMLTGRTTGGRSPPVQPPTKITDQSPTVAIPSSHSQPNFTVKPGSQWSTTPAPPRQSAVSVEKVSPSLANVEPVSQSAHSSPTAFTDQSSMKSSQSTLQEVQTSPSETSPVPSHLPPPTSTSSISVQPRHTSSSTASRGQVVPPDQALSTADQSLTGSASQHNTIFPPDEHPVNISLLTRQAKESLKSSLRRISGRLRDFHYFFWLIFKCFLLLLVS